MLYSFFRVIPRRLNFICRRFGTLFLLHRQVGMTGFEKSWSICRGKGLAKTFPLQILQLRSILKFSHTSYLPAYADGTDKSVSKRQHIKFRRRGITQKKAYEICSNSIRIGIVVVVH